MPKILIIAGDGTVSDHLDYAWMRMLEEGYDVTIAGPEARPLRTAIHQGSIGDYIFTFERAGYLTQAHAAFKDVDPSAYDALFLPGGRGPEYLRNREDCLALVRHFVEADKPISAICHGPLLLLAAGVTGRNLSCTDDTAIEVIEAGNTYVPTGGPSMGQPDHVRDGNIVTVRRRPYHYVWVRELLTMLEERGLRPASAPHPKAGAKVLMIAGDYTSGGQLLYALDRVREAGLDPVIAAPDKKRLDTIVDQREEGAEYDQERLGFWAYADLALADVNAADYAGLLLPGWRATEYLRNMADSKRIIGHFLETKKPIGSICQGARMLIAAGVHGKRMTGTDVIRTEIAMSNIYVDAGAEPVVDGHIVSVSGRPHYHVWTKAFLDLMAGR